MYVFSCYILFIIYYNSDIKVGRKMWETLFSPFHKSQNGKQLALSLNGSIRHVRLDHKRFVTIIKFRA